MACWSEVLVARRCKAFGGLGVTIDKRKLIIGLIVLLVITAAALGYSLTRGTAPAKAPTKAEIAAERKERLQDACSSASTYDRLKEVAFEEAVRIRNADPANLDTLATHSVVRMERPVVKSRDEDLNVTVCTGRFVLELPPGAERGFGGERRLVADIEYAAQAAADGSGLVYQISGAEPIIYKLAAFDLQGQRFQPPTVAPAPDYAQTDPVPIPAPMPQPQQQPRAQPEIPIAPEPRAEPRPQPRPDSIEPEPRAVARNRSNPSFNCRQAGTRSERMVCGDNQLAARDRAMSSIYYSAIADADGATKRRIRNSRDAFLSRRERCGSPACVAAVYDDRIDEIRRIAAGSD